MNGFDYRIAVVFVQAFPLKCLYVQARPLANTCVGLRMAAQGAHQHAVKPKALGRKVFTQAHSLLVTQWA